MHVVVSDLSALRQQWPDLVISGMTNRQLELEELRQTCKKKYCGAPTGLCTFCGKVIRLDMFRHVANYHLKLGQLWRCPVSWCTQWKGTPQDCINHIRLVHSVPVTVKAGFDFIECFTTTFLRAHSWLNWVDEDDDEHDEVDLKEKPEDTRYIKKITSK